MNQSINHNIKPYHSERKRRIWPRNPEFFTPLYLVFALFVITCFIAHNSYAETGSGGLWQRLKDMPEPREQHGFEALNGILYVVCGQSAPRTHKRDVYAYNINTNTWTTKAPAPIALQSPVLRAVNGKLYLIGGYDSTIPLKYDTTFEYDPAADAWTRKANMPTAREDMASAVVDGRIYIFAGITNPGLEITAAVEVYDPVTDTWQFKTKMPNPRCLGDFGCAYNGTVYLVSGTDNLEGYGSTLFPGTRVDQYQPSDLSLIHI